VAGNVLVGLRRDEPRLRAAASSPPAAGKPGFVIDPLDTNICIYALKNHPSGPRSALGRWERGGGCAGPRNLSPWGRSGLEVAPMSLRFGAKRFTGSPAPFLTPPQTFPDRKDYPQQDVVGGKPQLDCQNTQIFPFHTSFQCTKYFCLVGCRARKRCGFGFSQVRSPNIHLAALVPLPAERQSGSFMRSHSPVS
jgi:hypothetical protein